MRYDSIKQALRSAGTLRCSKAVRCLHALGFIVREGTTPNHKIFTHPQLSARTDFIAGSFSCEHGKDGEAKRPYLRNIIRVLSKYEHALKAIEKEGETHV